MLLSTGHSKPSMSILTCANAVAFDMRCSSRHDTKSRSPTRSVRAPRHTLRKPKRLGPASRSGAGTRGTMVQSTVTMRHGVRASTASSKPHSLLPPTDSTTHSAPRARCAATMRDSAHTRFSSSPLPYDSSACAHRGPTGPSASKRACDHGRRGSCAALGFGALSNRALYAASYSSARRVAIHASRSRTASSIAAAPPNNSGGASGDSSGVHARTTAPCSASRSHARPAAGVYAPATRSATAALTCAATRSAKRSLCCSAHSMAPPVAPPPSLSASVASVRSSEMSTPPQNATSSINTCVVLSTMALAPGR
mmetsp:Transcript_55625/g.136511  ORF Transcript_55625/g.136511 Transcript_55625/m.136511 type:complete len:311 (-) Transcript_55625:165-1097(-)